MASRSARSTASRRVTSPRSEEHTSELHSQSNLVCRLLLEKKNNTVRNEGMFTIIIQEKGGEQPRMVFNKPEVTIGRLQGNDIVLSKCNRSKRHAQIVLKDG